MASHLFDREIEAEKYKWEQSTTSWSAVAEDEERNITSTVLDSDKDRSHLAKKQRYISRCYRLLFKFNYY